MKRQLLVSYLLFWSICLGLSPSFKVKIRTYIILETPCIFCMQIFILPCTIFILPCTIFILPCTIFILPWTIFILPCTIFILPVQFLYYLYNFYITLYNFFNDSLKLKLSYKAENSNFKISKIWYDVMWDTLQNPGLGFKGIVAWLCYNLIVFLGRRRGCCYFTLLQRSAGKSLKSWEKESEPTIHRNYWSHLILFLNVSKLDIRETVLYREHCYP